MSIVTLSLPDVNPKTEIRPKVCPYCSGETFQRWGRVSKPVKDNRYRSHFGLPLSLLPLPSHLSILSQWGRSSRSNAQVAETIRHPMGAGDEFAWDLYGLIGIWSTAQPHDPVEEPAGTS